MSLAAVSVITPAWGRAGLLVDRCIPSVAAQDYAGPIEHVVVSDGPSPELRALLAGLPVIYDELPEHREQHWGVWPRRRALEIANGELIAYVDDDDAMRPHHVRVLVEALEREGADFAYSRVQLHDAGGLAGVVGHEPPQHAGLGTDSLLHRRSLLSSGTWEADGGYAVDWALVQRWLQAGARWTFVNEITADWYRS